MQKTQPTQSEHTPKASEAKIQQDSKAHTQSESALQQEIVKFYRNSFCLEHHNPRSVIFAVPNESNGARAMKLIQTGMLPGAPDLVIVHCKLSGPDIIKRIAFIEVKTESGRQSINQVRFQHHCEQSKIFYKVVRSLEEFKAIVGNL